MINERIRETVVAAAVKLSDGTIFTGTRHSFAMNAVWAQHPGYKITQDMQGFLTSSGRFVDRRIAGAVAFYAGQTREKKSLLLSEDVW